MTQQMSQQAWRTTASPTVETASARPFVARETRLVTILLVARLTTDAGDGLCRIRNISTGGMTLETVTPLTRDQQVRVELRNEHAVEGRIAWSRDGRAGVQFHTPIDVATVLHSAIGERMMRVPRSPRFVTDCPVTFRTEGRVSCSTLLDISQSGGKLRFTHLMTRDTHVTLTMPGIGPKRAAVRWVNEEEGGVVFLDIIPFAQLGTWLSDDSNRFAGRSRDGGTV